MISVPPRLFPPCRWPIWDKGEQPCVGRRPIFLEVFVSKSVGQRYGNALKALFLQRKTYFLSVKSQNFRACGAATLPGIPKFACLWGGHTLSNLKNFAPAARLYPSNFQIYKRLSRSLHMHKTFLTSVVGALKLYNIWIYERLRRSLHMHKTFLTIQIENIV